MTKTPGEKPPRIPWGLGRMAFFTHKETIQSLITKGWPLKHIYQHLAPNLNGLSYSMFAQHVKKYLTTPTANPIPSPPHSQEQPKTIRTATFFRPSPRIINPDELY